MPKPLLLLLVLVAAPGCVDSLGIGSNCALEMRSVRLSEGPPEDVERAEVGGNFTERWIYSNRTYTFRWGVSHESCQVDGPSSFSRSPAPAGE